MNQRDHQAALSVNLVKGICCASLILAAIFGYVPVQALNGAPEYPNYHFVDSNMPGGPAFNFEDISQSGSQVSLVDASSSDAIPLGFPFAFYDKDYSALYICANGYLSFVPANQDLLCPYPDSQIIPSTDLPNGLIAGWWGDLNPGAGGNIYYQTLGEAPNRRFIVEYLNIPHYNYANNKVPLDPVIMEYKFFETLNTIEVDYRTAPASNLGRDYLIPHSVGIENETGDAGIQYYYGTDSLVTPLAVRYYFNDTTPPVTKILSSPVHLTNQTSASFTFFGEDAESGVSSYYCKLDNNPEIICTSPVVYSNLIDGLHTFEVYAVDRFGHKDSAPAAYSWTIDTKVPVKQITILSPSDQTYTIQPNMLLKWLPVDGVEGYQINLNNILIEVGPYSEYQIGPLSPGEYIWSVQGYQSGAYMAFSANQKLKVGMGIYFPNIQNFQ